MCSSERILIFRSVLRFAYNALTIQFPMPSSSQFVRSHFPLLRTFAYCALTIRSPVPLLSLIRRADLRQGIREGCACWPPAGSGQQRSTVGPATFKRE